MTDVPYPEVEAAGAELTTATDPDGNNLALTLDEARFYGELTVVASRRPDVELKIQANERDLVERIIERLGRLRARELNRVIAVEGELDLPEGHPLDLGPRLNTILVSYVDALEAAWRHPEEAPVYAQEELIERIGTLVGAIHDLDRLAPKAIAMPDPALTELRARLPLAAWQAANQAGTTTEQADAIADAIRDELGVGDAPDAIGA